MKISVLTMFRTLRHSYSLVHVVANQLQVLMDHGHEVSLLVSETCKEDERYGVYLDERLKWVKVVNVIENKEITWYNYNGNDEVLHATFEEEVNRVAEDLEEKLVCTEICLMHDILYQGMHYLHNCAIRKVQEKLSCVMFLSFVHSFPDKRPYKVAKLMEGRYMPMPNTLYSFPTQAGISALAKQYNVPEGSCRVISHSLHLIEEMTEVVHKLQDRYNILEKEILIMCPSRLSVGKQLEKIACLGGALKTIGGVSIGIIFCDSTTRGTDGEAYKNHIKHVGATYGLEENECIFTSDLGYLEGIPKKSVLELFRLSNIYVCPSQSESFGIPVIEAAANGNILILNENVPALRELGKELGAYFMKWDGRNEEGIVKQDEIKEEPIYYGRHATHILKLYFQNTILTAKTHVRLKYANEWVYTNQLEPVLKELYKIGKSIKPCQL